MKEQRVFCQECGAEFGEMYLRDDLIWETELKDEEIEEIWMKSLSNGSQLTPQVRAALRKIGFVFGESVLDIQECRFCT